MISYNKILESGFIGNMELRNRVIMEPMVTNYAGMNGEVIERMVEYYRARAKGGCGMVVVESTETDTEVDESRVLPGCLILNSQDHVRGMATLTEAIHSFDCKAAIQLSLGGGRQCKYIPKGKKPKSSSSEPCGLTPDIVPEALTIKEIQLLVEQHSRAAHYSKMSGFDCIEFHAGHGYLLAQFLSPFMNKRNDDYGGNFKKRMRIMLEMIEGVQGSVGKDFPLIIRFSVDECVNGGRTVDESMEIAKILEAMGVHAIDVTSGCYESAFMCIPTMHQPKALFLKLAKAIRSVVNIPLILPGRLGDPEVAEKVLNEGIVDFIGLGRPLIADPEWVNKVKSGRSSEIRRCVSCNCCFDQIVNDKYLHCALNAQAGREVEFKSGYGKTEKKKKVLIVGSGPAGMEAAYACGIRGHDVTICEKETELGGGQLKMASISPGKSDINNISRYYNNILNSLDNVDIRLNTWVDKDYILNEKPDSLIIATGAIAYVPNIKGINKSIVKNGFDLLAGKVSVRNRIIVIGGGLIGCDITVWLDSIGKDVVQTTRQNSVGHDIEWLHMMYILEHYRTKHIKTVMNITYREIKDNGLLLDNGGREMFLEADDIVLATGTRSDNKLYDEIKDLVPDSYLIGDAKKPRTMLWGIYEAFNLSVNVLDSLLSG